jgi:2'-5' RNA ligase
VSTAHETLAAPHEELRDHWQWRPEWAIDRPCLLWYLTFENQPRLWQLAEELQGPVRNARTVDPVPPAWLHLTLEDVAFVDELAPGQVDEIVALAASAIAGWSAPALTLGPVLAMGSALVLEARPRRELSDLRDRLRACTALAVGPERVRGPDHFRPHVSFGYVNGPCRAEAVLEPLEDWAAEQVVVPVPQLTLAAVTRRNRHYQWTARATLDLEVAASVGQPGEVSGPDRCVASGARG